MATVQSLLVAFEEVFRESLTEQLSESEIPLFGSLVNENAIVIRNPDDQELFYYSQSNLDEFLVTHIPSLISFPRARLTEWAKEAIAFFRTNSDHPQFEDIFSTRLHYDVVIHSMVKYDFSTNELRRTIFEDMKVHSVYVPTKYPLAFRNMVRDYTRTSINNTLRVIAHELIQEEQGRNRKRNREHSRLSRIKKEPSYKDVRGIVPFLSRQRSLRLVIRSQKIDLKNINHYLTELFSI